MRKRNCAKEMRRLRERILLLERQVRLDPFTGLYNKTHGAEAIRQILDGESSGQHALLFLDTDGFKAINDSLGHAAGDEIIRDLARRLTACFRPDDVISRFGGDEYLVLARDVPDRRWLTDRLDALAVCDHPVCSYTNSVGVALFPEDGRSFDALFQKADQALYSAKARKCTYVFASGPDTVYNRDPLAPGSALSLSQPCP